MLTALDRSCFSSTYRNDCHTSFSVTVKFEVSTLPRHSQVLVADVLGTRYGGEPFHFG